MNLNLDDHADEVIRQAKKNPIFSMFVATVRENLPADMKKKIRKDNKDLNL